MKVGINFQTRDEYLSGVEYYGLGLIRALVRYAAGDRYVVFTNRPGLVTRHIGDHAHLCVRRIGKAKTRIGRIWWEHTSLPKLAEREGLDLLHCPAYICPVRACVVPCVVTVHDTFALDRPEWCTGLNAAYYRLFMRRGLARAAAVAAVSRWTAGALERLAPDVAGRVHVIRPGIDEIFAVRPGRDALEAVRARYGLPDRYILYVGNIEPKKNLSALLDAHEILRRRPDAPPLVLVGKRQWRSADVRERLAQMVEQGTAVAPGYVRREDLPAVYQMAALYVCVSLAEGFGFPPLEAMASGTPVLSPTCSALAETAAAAAVEIDPGVPSQIAETIAALLDDEEQRAEYARRGLAHSRRFTWRRTAGQLRALYRRVMT